MAAAAEVRRSGGCHPSRHVHRIVVTRWKQQDSGIDNGSRFGKLFLVSKLTAKSRLVTLGAKGFHLPQMDLSMRVY